MSEPAPEDFDDFDYDDGPDYGCVSCGYQAWNHTCCDDMCRACNEPEDCESGSRPCPHCNPHGDIR